MSLTKDQLQEIEKYLKKKDVKFWDVRYELVDHIACEIEKKIELYGLGFKEAFGLIKEKYDYETLENHIKVKGKYVRKVYFKSYGLELKNSLTNPLFMAVNILVMMLSFYLLNEVSAKVSLRPYMVIVLGVLITWLYYILRYHKINNRSLLLNFVASQVMVFSMLPNFLPLFTTKEKLRTIYAEENIVFYAVISFLTIVGFKMFLKMFKKQKEQYQLIYG